MKQNGYIIYITKSKEAAKVLHEGLQARREKEGYISTESGYLGQDIRIPAMYRDIGLYYALAVLNDDCEHQMYQLNIC